MPLYLLLTLLPISVSIGKEVEMTRDWDENCQSGSETNNVSLKVELTRIDTTLKLFQRSVEQGIAEIKTDIKSFKEEHKSDIESLNEGHQSNAKWASWVKVHTWAIGIIFIILGLIFTLIPK